jgi:hypothetical protein
MLDLLKKRIFKSNYKPPYLELFEVMWADKTTTLLPRLYIMFLAEDPENFALRILWAHQQRKEGFFFFFFFGYFFMLLFCFIFRSRIFVDINNVLRMYANR